MCWLVRSHLEHNSEATMLQKFIKRKHECSTAAMMLQRVYRARTLRRLLAAHRHALTIQRVYRGYVARVFVQELFVVMSLASTHIQAVFRSYTSRERTKSLRNRKTAGAVHMQRVFRGYQARKWVFWIRFHVASAIQIQRVARGLMGRQVRFENRMASRIGAAGRGYLARQVYKREVRKIRVRTVVVPAARTIQRVYRGFVVRKHLEEFRDQVEAAKAGERTVWRASIDRIKSHAALTVQCLVRSYFARLRVEAKRAKQRGRHGQAAVVVQSAWRSYFNRKAIQSMRELMAIEVYARKFTALKDNLEMVQFDMADTMGDIAYMTKHRKKSLQQIHDLKQMRLDWELRVPVLDKELSNMTGQDIARGWQTAFETEKLVIHFSMLLSAEEIQSKKQQIATLDAEYEDLERDVDESLLQETSLMEDYRRLELQRASSQYMHHAKQSVRRQRLRWKVRTNRSNLVLREAAALARSIAPPPSTCLSYAGRMASRRESDERVRQHNAHTHATKMEALKGSSNLHVVAVADAVVAECRKIVNAGSLAMQLDRSDLRDDPAAAAGMCTTCGHMQCVCHVLAASTASNAPSNAAPILNGSRKRTNNGPGIALGRRRRHHRQTDGVVVADDENSVQVYNPS
ncbi:hypothetical protein DYB37_003889 [Aphanomyces astaci]|uniref:Uncharacterized protein n=1 Tax=Aphanomyces astaci TaxID=112090 RepID=A0A3R7BHH3_APHAT|nr:hypothetical protein DYB35_001581 [Aphanomyces astaci]RHZ30741.1 hypothetical protein DYB37_003889 [Aphanomyces astaci]